MTDLHRIQDIQEFLHFMLRSLIKPDDILVDATAGKGRDTIFLAKCVTGKGKVYAFDIQEEAIAHSQKLLQEHGLDKKVIFYQMDHACMGEVVRDRIGAAVFNLGYLPGSNHAVKTQAESTIPALQSALKLLKVNGVLALTVYRGHLGAEEEATQVQTMMRNLPKDLFSVLCGQYINQIETAPYWILVQKKRED